MSEMTSDTAKAIAAAHKDAINYVIGLGEELTLPKIRAEAASALVDADNLTAKRAAHMKRYSEALLVIFDAALPSMSADQIRRYASRA